MTILSRPSIAVLETDLFIAVRIEEAVKAAGARPLVAADANGLWDAIERWPELVIVDLGVAGWEEPVRRSKNLPHTRAIPIVAFGSHVDTGALRAARAAGCDHAWARSRFVSELPDLLHQTLHPTARKVEGWDEPPPDALCRGIAQFNAGEYWECHETLEALWMAETRPVRDLYQGILQVGVAFHHLLRGNHEGALKMLRRGLPHLRGLPEVCQGVQVTRLAKEARALHDRILDEGAGAQVGIDAAMLPRVAADGCVTAETNHKTPL